MLKKADAMQNVFLKAENVSISFPLYDMSDKSLKQATLAAVTGGKLGRSDDDRVVVKALDNVSLSMEQGDRVALIGHNGSGKTTLLRALSGVYEPVAGQVIRSGEVMPVFDASIGTDPDLSGYDNILLRGLYLNIRHKMTDDFVKSIVDYSGLGEFIHMPVRTYSMGMLARLQFAVVTAVQPDIMLIDEGIGAGDQAFFDKAEKRIERIVSQSGILVLASHSAALLRQMCQRGVVMEQGRIIFDGGLEDALTVYEDLTRRAANAGHAANAKPFTSLLQSAVASQEEEKQALKNAFLSRTEAMQKIRAALEAYHQDHGVYPVRREWISSRDNPDIWLEELKPDYLETIPACARETIGATPPHFVYVSYHGEGYKLLAADTHDLGFLADASTENTDGDLPAADPRRTLNGGLYGYWTKSYADI